MTMRKIRSILLIISLLFVLCLLAALLIPLLRGYELYSVQSGSMEPALPQGSLIAVEEVDPAEIQVGDAITFISADNPLPVTHRVVSINSAQREFITRGDGNSANDASPVPFANLRGRVVFSLPYFGYLTQALRTPWGSALLISPVLLAGLLFLPDLIRVAAPAHSKPGAAR